MCFCVSVPTESMFGLYLSISLNTVFPWEHPPFKRRLFIKKGVKVPVFLNAFLKLNKCDYRENGSEKVKEGSVAYFLVCFNLNFK